MRTFVVAVLCLVLAACSSGNRPEWWRTNMTDAQVGQMRLVHVNVEAPPMAEQKVGGNLPLYVTLFNDSDVEQVLDAVSTVEAKRVVYRDASGTAVNDIRLTIPPKGELSLQKGEGRPHLELVGVNRQLGAAPIAVTFRFPRAGAVTVRVPVIPVS